MNRALMLAAELFDPFRTPADVTVHDDGSFTESAMVTAAQIARARRDPAVAALWDRYRRAP
jgi:hypothetical protein